MKCADGTKPKVENKELFRNRQWNKSICVLNPANPINLKNHTCPASAGGYTITLHQETVLLLADTNQFFCPARKASVFCIDPFF